MYFLILSSVCNKLRSPNDLIPNLGIDLWLNSIWRGKKDLLLGDI